MARDLLRHSRRILKLAYGMAMAAVVEIATRRDPKLAQEKPIELADTHADAARKVRFSDRFCERLPIKLADGSEQSRIDPAGARRLETLRGENCDHHFEPARE